MASSGNTWFKKLQAKQRRNTLRVLGVKKRFAVEPEQDVNVKKVREYLAPVKTSYVPAKPRGRNCVRLSHEKRLSILTAAEARMVRRREFFAALGVSV